MKQVMLGGNLTMRTFLVAAALIFIPLSALSQQAEFARGEQESAERQIGAYIRPGRPIPLSQSSFRFEDGVPGKVLPAALSSPIRVELPGLNDSENQLWTAFCSPAIKVVATAGGSISTLSRDRTIVLTKTVFTVDSSPHFGKAFSGKPFISVVRPGGEALDNAVKVRFVYNYQEPFVAGRKYLLTLTPSSDVPGSYVTRQDTVEVRDGALRMSKPWLGFPPGTSLAEVEHLVSGVFAKAKCDASR